MKNLEGSAYQELKRERNYYREQVSFLTTELNGVYKDLNKTLDENRGLERKYDNLMEKCVRMIIAQCEAPTAPAKAAHKQRNGPGIPDSAADVRIEIARLLGEI